MPDQVFVIGHVNPDTDAIASAMGYAWLLKERDGLATWQPGQGRLTLKLPGF
jgi:inorganic pyrophosphatase/exopolyphosphatase